MAEPFIGEIILAGFNFAPIGYALCNGQLLSIAQNTALYSLLGTTYGGDGQVTFGLPDLQGRAPVHQGQGPGLSNEVIGEVSGSESVTLISSQMPTHTHTVRALSTNGNLKTPANNILANVQGTATNIYSATAADTNMKTTMITQAGGNQPHENMEPFLTINFCIAVEGIFPSRN
jgi:microcystin-dependent protein